MTLLDALLLGAVMVALAALPSTSVALVVTRAATGGFAQGAAVAAGVVSGDLAFALLAISGMTALAEAMGGLFFVIKWLAGLYLIWVGISLLRSRSGPVAFATGRAGAGLITSFTAGLVVTLGDVKAIFFYASLFPTFVDLATLRTADLALILLITLAAVGGVKLVFAYYAVKVVTATSARFHAPPKQQPDAAWWVPAPG